MFFLYFVVFFLMFPSLILASFCRIKLGNKLIFKCCKGYDPQEINGIPSCIPICQVDCGMGVCIMPNTCNCTEGYVLSEGLTSNTCKPHCTKGCPNGQCSAPEFCDCNPGYKWNKDSKQCDPFCNSGCPNARCESPGKCICNEGYKQLVAQTDAGETQTDAGCEPICEMKCGINRTCTAPETCGCIEGFIEINEECVQVELLVGGLLFLILIGWCIFLTRHKRVTYHVALREKQLNPDDYNDIIPTNPEPSQILD